MISGGGAVLQLADYGAPYSGTFIGALRTLARICEQEMGLRTVFGFSACVGERGWVEELRRDGFTVRFLDRDAPLRARAAAVAELARQADAALVHCHFGVYDVPAWIAARRSPRRFPVAWHRHNGFPVRRSAASTVKDRLKLRFLGRDAWILSVSQPLHDEALAEGAPRHRAFCIENGVDLARVTRPSEARHLLRARLGIAPTTRVILLFGWDPVRKGVDLGVRAMESLGRRSDCVLLAVGSEQLHDFLSAGWKELPPSVRIVETQESVADLFAVSDVFLSASRDEGFSYAIGEAMANGLPCVVSDIESARWAHAGGALFFPNEDAAALEARLEEVLSWPAAIREQRTALGRAFAATNLSLERWARRVSDIYRRALAERQDRNARRAVGGGGSLPGRSGADAAADAASIHGA